MFFRKKRRAAASDSEPGKKATPPPLEGSLPAGESGATSPPTQFLTGEAVEDRQKVKVLLEAIAGVSGSQDL